MSDIPALPVGSETSVLVRYWASARAAAGTACDEVPVSGQVSVADIVDRLLAQHADRPRGERFAEVLAACSVLVGDQPVGTRAHETVAVGPGQCVEFLPPFAGG